MIPREHQSTAAITEDNGSGHLMETGPDIAAVAADADRDVAGASGFAEGLVVAHAEGSHYM